MPTTPAPPARPRLTRWAVVVHLQRTRRLLDRLVHLDELAASLRDCARADDTGEALAFFLEEARELARMRGEILREIRRLRIDLDRTTGGLE